MSPSVGSFSPTGSFVPNEAGQQILDLYKNRYGVPLEIRSMNPSELQGMPGVGGYFRSAGADSAGYGGSFDPKRRVVFLNPDNATASILAHEGYHAYDPYLPKEQRATQIGREVTGNALLDAAANKAVRDPKAFLEAHLTKTGPREVARVEAITQRGAKDVLSELGIPHPEADRPWYAGYPQSYVEKGIDSAVDLMTIPRGPEQFTGGFMKAAIQNLGNPTPGGYVTSFSGDTVYDYGKDKALQMLDMFLDPSFRRAVDKASEQAKTYTDRVIYSGK
jgi:hypothetical protein